MSTDLNKDAITLIFSPEFGAPEPVPNPEPGRSRIYHLRDKLAGQIRTYRPIAHGGTFCIGRSPSCHIRLGYDPRANDFRRNELDQTQFRHFSNIHATFQLLDQGWYIFAGGEYPDRGGEWGSPGNGLYVNGALLPGERDPYPLFYRGDKYSRVQLGDAGKIIFMQGVFGEQSTSIPPEWWSGEGWPNMEEIHRARKKQEAAQRKLDQTDGGQSQAHNEGIKPQPVSGPWGLASLWGPAVWDWYKRLNWFLQLIYTSGAGVLIFLLAELWLDRRE